MSLRQKLSTQAQIPVVKENTQVAASYMQHREPTLPKLSLLAVRT